MQRQGPVGAPSQVLLSITLIKVAASHGHSLATHKMIIVIESMTFHLTTEPAVDDHTAGCGQSSYLRNLLSFSNIRYR